MTTALGKGVTMHRLALYAGGLVAFLAALLFAFLADDAPKEGQGSLDDPRLASFARWPALYQEMDIDRNFPVTLSYNRGLSQTSSSAKGKAVINFQEGVVEVSVQGLPALPATAVYEKLLVDNQPGPDNSVAIDRGPDGDDIINLGELQLQGEEASLVRQMDPARLRDFEVDMVAVTRRGPEMDEEFVIGGVTSLFYKMGRKNSVAAEQRRDLPDNPALALLSSLWRKLTPASTASASGPAAQSQAILALIDQGETLFFDETFDGNGRTCGTCHRADQNFAIDPAFIAMLPSTDLLFVAELVPALAKLEDPALMRGPRGLILENIDGFGQPPVFRAPPPTVNMAFTGPYGLSGEFATISDFDIGAVAQHFTKNTGGDPDNITRVAGSDFRTPTQAELDAFEAFQLSTFIPRRADFELNKFLTTNAQQSGRDLFFGSAKCSQCHGGTVLSDADQGLGGGNQSFNTGVVNLPINLSGGDDLLALFPEGPGGNRESAHPPSSTWRTPLPSSTTTPSQHCGRPSPFTTLPSSIRPPRQIPTPG